jgi:hypothetical protein
MLTKPRLFDQVRERLRFKHYSIHTEQAYLGWMKRAVSAPPATEGNTPHSSRTVVIALATPDGTYEVLIPRDRYDAFVVLGMVRGWEAWRLVLNHRLRGRRRRSRLASRPAPGGRGGMGLTGRTPPRDPTALSAIFG